LATETEVKFYLQDLDSMRRKLASVGAHEIKPRVFERNFRYDDGTLGERGIVLRLRQDTRIRLTYKGANQRSAQASSREELETEVTDFDTMDAILKNLGFDVAVIYEKYRTTYEFMNTEIVLDELPIGNFMEIEGELDALEAAVEALDLSASRRITVSYLELFRDAKTALNLSAEHLSFEAFEGIEVPSSIFS
jgi:adenylate cyclase, class 2